MGMIFNTNSTLVILDLINTAFKPTRFADLKNNNAAILALLNAVPMGVNATPLVNGLYPVAQSLYIDFDDAAGSRYLSLRWQKWLRILDANLQNNTNTSISYLIAQKMISALNAVHCLAIEFFAVPGNGMSVALWTYPMANQNYISIISVTTKIVDDL